MRLLIIFLCLVGVLGRRGSLPKPGVVPSREQVVRDEWGYPYGGLDMMCKHPEEPPKEVGVKQVKRGKSSEAGCCRCSSRLDNMVC
jgi:hypothetical protein